MKPSTKVKAILTALVTTFLVASPVFASEAARIEIAELPGDLSVLTDDAGRVLYASTADESGISNCTGECAEMWEPLLTEGRAIVGPGLVPGFVGSLERDEGTQVTFFGQPLYYYTGDTEPGDLLGHGIDDSWFVVTHMGPLHTDPIQDAEVVLAEVEFEVDEEVLEAGRVLYAADCASCHGSSGAGGGGGPAIAGGTNIGNTNYVLSQIIHGGAEMPSFGGRYDNEQVAAVSTFIRTSFGNSYPPVEPDDAEAVR